MLRCDGCDFWVHISCGGVDEDKYKAMMKSDQEEEWHCPKCRGEVEVSDDELDDKVAPLADPDRVVQVPSSSLLVDMSRTLPVFPFREPKPSTLNPQPLQPVAEITSDSFGVRCHESHF